MSALSETGLLRALLNPRVGGLSTEEAMDILTGLEALPSYRFWEATAGWTKLSAPFLKRVFGHQQVTDAYLLGLAVQEDGVLVTLDRGISYLAGREYKRNLLVLE